MQLRILVAALLSASLFVAHETARSREARAQGRDLVPCNPGTYTHREIFEAIRWVESSHRKNPPRGKAGELGGYQILPAYWKDASDYDRALGGQWTDVKRDAYAERVLSAYMRRYCPNAWKNRDAQTIARTHNGGPRGPFHRSTFKYWTRVKRYLRRARDKERRSLNG